jgi:hypothetical protein
MDFCLLLSFNFVQGVFFFKTCDTEASVVRLLGGEDLGIYPQCLQPNL